MYKEDEQLFAPRAPPHSPAVVFQVKMTNIRIIYPWKLNWILSHQGKVYAQSTFIEGQAYFVRSSNESEPLILNE